MLLGAHVSIAKGVYLAPSRGEEIGANAIQIFSKNQAQWVGKPLTEEDAEKFRQAWQQSTIEAVVIHVSYLINLGSPDEVLLKKSRDAFLDEMDRAELLGVPNLVFHPGSCLKETEEFGLNRIIESLNFVLNERPNYKVRPLLETTAGQGTNLGYTFEQLDFIRQGLKQNERTGICLDTAHIFAAGYDIRTRETYENTLAKFDKVLGLNNLYVIHMNDSRKPLGSRVDRHENIGKGLIGLEAFRFIMTDPRLENIPKILETPGGPEAFKKDIKTLKDLTTGLNPGPKGRG